MDSGSEIEDIIHRLETGLPTPGANLLIDLLKGHAKQSGLSPDDILRLTKLCVRNTIKDIKVRNNLVDALIPEDIIPEEAAICVFLKICSRKCPESVAKNLLMWLEAKFDCIQPKSKLITIVSLFIYFNDSVIFGPIMSRLASLILNDYSEAYGTVRMKVVREFFPSIEKPKADITIHNCTCFEDVFAPCIKKMSIFTDIKLDDNKFQFLHFAAISPLSDTTMHIQLYLNHKLSLYFIENSGKVSDFDEAMRSFFYLDDIVQSTSEVWVTFLTDYLLSWNLSDKCETILKFISRLPKMHFSILQHSILNGLKKAVLFSPDVALKCEIIDSLQTLIMRYIILASRCKDEDERKSFETLIINMIHFIENIVLECSILKQDFLVLEYSVLDLWESVSMMSQRYQLPLNICPHPLFLANALFGFSAHSLNSICNSIHLLTKVKSSQKSPKASDAVLLRDNFCNILCHNYPEEGDFLRLQTWISESLGLRDVMSNRQDIESYAFDKHPAFSIPLLKMRHENQGDFYLGEFLNSLDKDGLDGISKMVRGFLEATQ